jgi:hypothetical protein
MPDTIGVSPAKVRAFCVRAVTGFELFYLLALVRKTRHRRGRPGSSLRH